MYFFFGNPTIQTGRKVSDMISTKSGGWQVTETWVQELNEGQLFLWHLDERNGILHATLPNIHNELNIIAGQSHN